MVTLYISYAEDACLFIILEWEMRIYAFVSVSWWRLQIQLWSCSIGTLKMENPIGCSYSNQYFQRIQHCPKSEDENMLHFILPLRPCYIWNLNVIAKWEEEEIEIGIQHFLNLFFFWNIWLFKVAFLEYKVIWRCCIYVHRCCGTKNRILPI